MEDGPKPVWAKSKSRIVHERKREIAQDLIEYVPTPEICAKYSAKFGVGEAMIRRYISMILTDWAKEFEEDTDEKTRGEFQRAIRTRREIVRRCLSKPESTDHRVALAALDSLAKILGWIDKPQADDKKITVVFHRPEQITDDKGDDISNG